MYSDTVELKSYLQTIGLFQDQTYTYVKKLPVYVVGYSTGNIQIIKDRILYGGIRDVGAYIYGNLESVDLSAYIQGVGLGVDLYGYIKSINNDYINLYGYVKSVIAYTVDLPVVINGQFLKNTMDLTGWLFSVSPIDLVAYLNIIEIKDLYGYIIGDLYKGAIDLSGEIRKIFKRDYINLYASIHGFGSKDLSAFIFGNMYSDLQVFVQVVGYSDIVGYIYTVAPKNLYAYIHGFDIRDLSASIVGGYGPNDLQAYITAIPYKSLQAYITGYGGIGIPTDLSAFISGSYGSNLSAFISAILPVDLSAYINVTGKTLDLRAYIYPMVITLKKMLQISLLEHKNLYAIINSYCFNSSYRELQAYIYALMKSDLKAYIVGWDSGSTDRMGELKAYINTENYLVEDNISIKILPNNVYSSLNIKFTDNSGSIYNVFDTISIKFGNFYGKDLSAYINCMPPAINLSAYIRAIQELPYTSVPPYMKLKTREVVLNVERFEERIRRVAELFFDNYGGNTPFYYFYVEGENKVYKLDRNKHWILRAEGFSRAAKGFGIDRQGVRKKFILKMYEYNTVDEAVRDLIDRVTFLRRSNLEAYINCELPFHYDLIANINVRSRSHWRSYLTSFIKPVGDSYNDFNCNIDGVLLESINDLVATIMGQQVYIPPDPNIADFNFLIADAGYIPSIWDNANYEFNVEE